MTEPWFKSDPLCVELAAIAEECGVTVGEVHSCVDLLVTWHGGDAEEVVAGEELAGLYPYRMWLTPRGAKVLRIHLRRVARGDYRA